MSSTSSFRRPLVTPTDVAVGVYLADDRRGKLYRVADVRLRASAAGLAPGRRRVAMLEDAATEDIEPWDFVELAKLRVVRPAGA